MITSHVRRRLRIRPFRMRDLVRVAPSRLEPTGLAIRPSRLRDPRRTADRPDRIRVTIVIPAHNEELRLAETLRAYGPEIHARYGTSAEILVVANACTDGTVGLAEQLRTELPSIRVIDLPDAIGKGGAILAGFREARGERIAFADADGATEIGTLLGLLDGLDHDDVVIGSRRMADSRIIRAQPLRRRVLSRVFNLAARVTFGLPYGDTQCGAKAFRAGAAHHLSDVVTESRWVFDIDVLLWARRSGLSISEQAVVWTDVAGSRLAIGSTAREVVGSLWRLWREHGRSTEVVSRRDQLATTSGPVAERAVMSGQRRRILALNWRWIDHPEAGGAELNLYEQVSRWARLGYDVTVVAARSDDRQPATEVVDGVTIRRMGGRFSVYARAALHLLRHGRAYDAVLDVANGIPFFAPLFTRTPATLLVHHVADRQWFTEFSRPVAMVGWMLERFLVPLVYRSTPVIAVSPTTRSAIIETGIREDQVEVVYNGVDLGRLIGLSVAAPEPDAHRPGLRVVYVGRIKRYKRLDLLVRAMASIRDEFPGVHLDIGGDGDARPEIEALVGALGLGDSVTIHGYLDEAAKVRLLGAATVFATPSMQEGWGLSVIEANAVGCPAVSYDVPGLRNAIVHGETGLLADDDAGFAAAISRLLRQPDLRDRLSTGARAWASRFDWDTCARSTLRILDADFAVRATVDRRGAATSDQAA